MELLKDPDLSYDEIAEITNTSFGLVDSVYCKRTWTHLSENVDFPQRSSTSFRRKLTDDQVREIIDRLLNNEKDEEIAKDYGVTWRTIRCIRLHEIHKELTEGIEFDSRQPIGEDIPCAKLTNDEVVDIVRLYNDGEDVNIIADMYPVATSAIVDILTRKSWKSITKDLYIRPYVKMKRLKKEEVIEILCKTKQGYEVPSLAEEYGVGISCIYRIIRGKTWKSIDRSLV